MFDVGFNELVLLFVIGMLVLGPQRLPKVAAEIGKWVGRARRTATQLRRQLEREIELAEIQPPKPPPPSQPASPAEPAPPTPEQQVSDALSDHAAASSAAAAASSQVPETETTAAPSDAAREPQTTSAAVPADSTETPPKSG